MCSGCRSVLIRTVKVLVPSAVCVRLILVFHGEPDILLEACGYRPGNLSVNRLLEGWSFEEIEDYGERIAGKNAGHVGYSWCWITIGDN